MGECFCQDVLNTTNAIDNRRDPYEIMELVFPGHCIEYTREVEECAHFALANLIYADTTYDDTEGLLVIDVLLDMMRDSEYSSHQGFGVGFFKYICVKTPYGKMPPVVFVRRMDDIEELVKKAVNKFYRVPYECSWIQNASKLLTSIPKMRSGCSRYTCRMSIDDVL
jgi:hypothetical protein